MPKRSKWTPYLTLAALTALSVALLLMFKAPIAPPAQNVQTLPTQTHLPEPSAAQTPEPSPSPNITAAPARNERGEDWFVGDWAGVISLSDEDDSEWSDFGAAMREFLDESLCLFRVYKTDAGYQAALGRTLWSITEYDKSGFTATCLSCPQQNAAPDSVYDEGFAFDVGQTIAFTYSRKVKSTEPAAEAPERDILFGVASPKEYDSQNYRLMLAFLPAGGEGSDYPRWFGGYENMDGDLHGIFCLGVNDSGQRILGEVLAQNEAETVVATRDAKDDNGSYHYFERDMRGGDLTEHIGMYDSCDAEFVRFLRYSAAARKWTDVSSEHKSYYKEEYIPRINAEIAEYEAAQRDVWAERGLLARRAFIAYAERIISGAFDGDLEQLIPYIPLMAQLESEYRPATSLAGIKPGDTIADAGQLYPIRELRQDEAAHFDMEGSSLALAAKRIKYYTDGEGLLLSVYTHDALERISKVKLFASGYETPDGRQVGDVFDRARMLIYAKDAVLEFGGWYLESGKDKIDVISMTVALDRVWDETLLDIDGDGVAERLTLSGRAIGESPERPSVFYDWESGALDPLDFGTDVFLSVYRDEQLVYEQVIPIMTMYFTSEFCDKLQPDAETGEVVIFCETGGSGLEVPVYSIKISADGFITEYMGCVDIYSD